MIGYRRTAASGFAPLRRLPGRIMRPDSRIQRGNHAYFARNEARNSSRRDARAGGTGTDQRVYITSASILKAATDPLACKGRAFLDLAASTRKSSPFPGPCGSARPAPCFVLWNSASRAQYACGLPLPGHAMRACHAAREAPQTNSRGMRLPWPERSAAAPPNQRGVT
jgi:hypothetical protein